MNLLTLSIVWGVLILQVTCGESFRRTCYYVFTNDTKLAPSQLDADLCTHLIIGWVPVTDGRLTPGKAGDEERYREAVQLKLKNPSLKVMVSTGGDDFHDLSLNRDNRTRFASSTVDFLKKYDLDGLDIDWEFPVRNSRRFEDKPNFVLLLKELRVAFDAQRKSLGRNLVLSVAVPADVTLIVLSYDVSGMARYVDFVNLMCYDYYFYKWFYPITGHNSALFQRKEQLGYFSTLNTKWSANFWHSKGMPKAKIMVGIPTYARSYKLLDHRIHGPGAPAIGAGDEFTFGQVCDLLKNNGTVRVFDSEAKVPYAYNGNLWISYEDIESVTAKANWIKSEGFGGSMTFDLNNDDVDYKCSNDTKFVLHHLIRTILP